MSVSDVSTLVDYEKRTGDSVASWQVRGLWDTNKSRVRSAEDAKTLSDAMRALEDCFLRYAKRLLDQENAHFLLGFLSPQWAFNDVEFTGLDRALLSFEGFQLTKVENQGRQSTASRAVRIAFESLREYSSKSPADRKVSKRFFEAKKEQLALLANELAKCKLSKHAKDWNVVIHADIPAEQRQEAIWQLLQVDLRSNVDDYAQLRTKMKQLFQQIGTEAEVF